MKHPAPGGKNYDRGEVLNPIDYRYVLTENWYLPRNAWPQGLIMVPPASTGRTLS